MAEKDLKKLLSSINPKPAEGSYYFASVDESQLMLLASYLEYIVAFYREEEGLTVVFLEDIRNEIEELTEKISGPFALITLGAESSLLAVGPLARITKALAEQKISVNAFSAYHHDHIFVPLGRKGDALKVLNQLKTE